MKHTVPVVLCAVVPLVALASCVRVNGGSGVGSLSLAANNVRISVRGTPDATIESDGRLMIRGQAVPLSAPEQTLAREYYRRARDVINASKATGEAGGRMGLRIIGSLFSALWHDNSAIIDHTAHAQAANVKTHLGALCAQLKALEAAQDELAAEQPAFAGYRVIRNREVTQCVKGMGRHVTATYAY